MKTNCNPCKARFRMTLVALVILAATIPTVVQAGPVQVKPPPILPDVSGCSGTLVRVVVGHQVEVYGEEVDLKSGVARLSNRWADSGVFIHEKTEGSNWFYVMSGSSPQGQCLNRVYQTTGTIGCLLNLPVQVWMEWAHGAYEWMHDVLENENPLPPCNSD